MRIEWSRAALADLDRFASFLHDRHPQLASRVAQTIIEKMQLLAQQPRLGRVVGAREEYRQIALRILKAIYVFQYRIEGDSIIMLRVYHAREERDT